MPIWLSMETRGSVKSEWSGPSERRSRGHGKHEELTGAHHLARPCRVMCLRLRRTVYGIPTETFLLGKLVSVQCSHKIYYLAFDDHAFLDESPTPLHRGGQPAYNYTVVLLYGTRWSGQWLSNPQLLLTCATICLLWSDYVTPGNTSTYVGGSDDSHGPLRAVH
jgi:hypothetical protein